MTNDTVPAGRQELEMTNEGNNYFNNIVKRYLHLSLDAGHLAFILILLSSLLFFFKLGSFSLYDAVETTYGEFIKQIRLTGDWLTLHYNGEIIFDKPPLYFWLATIATLIFGFNEFAVRFWAALGGVLTVITTFYLGKTFYNERTGFLSGLIAMTSFQFLIQSRIAELDILLTLLIVSALFFFYKGYMTQKKSFYRLMYLVMALGLLTKGIIGIAVPGFAIFLFLIFKKDFFQRIKELQVITALFIIFLVGAPWYIAEWIIHGQEFTDFALGFLFLSRFKGVVAGHPGPWYYYFLAIILGFAPWSHFLPYSLIKTWKNRLKDPELLTLCFIIPVFIVFSIARTKLPSYLLPIYPVLAIMVGKLWDDFLSEEQAMRKGMAVASILLGVVTTLIIIGFIMLGTSNYSGQYQELMPNLKLLAGILITGSIISIVSYAFRQYRLSLAAIPSMVLIITFVLTTQTLPMVEKFKGTKELAQKVSAVIKENEQIAAYMIGNRPGVVFYNSRPIVFLEDEEQLISFLKEKKGYCFTTLSEYEKIKTRTRVFEKRGELVVLY